MPRNDMAGTSSTTLLPLADDQPDDAAAGKVDAPVTPGGTQHGRGDPQAERLREDAEALAEMKRADVDIAKDGLGAAAGAGAAASTENSGDSGDRNSGDAAGEGGAGSGPGLGTNSKEGNEIPSQTARTSGGLPGRQRPFATLGGWYRLMAAEDPLYFRRIAAFADLDAWRPLTPAEAAREPLVNPMLSKGARERALAVHEEAESLRGSWTKKTPQWRAVAGGLPPRFWANALAVPLPFAPNMSVLCTHGVSRPAERGYHYVSVSADPIETKWSGLAGLARARRASMQDARAERAAGEGRGAALQAPQNENLSKGTSMSLHAPMPGGGKSGDPMDGDAMGSLDGPAGAGVSLAPGLSQWVPHVMATDVHDPESKTEFGVAFADGDGTVPVMSLGLMCEAGWRQRARNPAGAPVETLELPHLGGNNGVGAGSEATK